MHIALLLPSFIRTLRSAHSGLNRHKCSLVLSSRVTFEDICVVQSSLFIRFPVGAPFSGHPAPQPPLNYRLNRKTSSHFSFFFRQVLRVQDRQPSGAALCSFLRGSRARRDWVRSGQRAARPFLAAVGVALPRHLPQPAVRNEGRPRQHHAQPVRDTE